MPSSLTGGAILFISWQAGLGHITRDLAIVRALRRRMPDLQVSWMAHQLASRVLREAGETLLPESEGSADYNQEGAPALDGFKANVMKYVRLTRRARDHNAALFQKVIASRRFDLVIGDESYEVADAMQRGQIQMDCRMILIEDFVGLDAMSPNPLEHVGIHLRNRRRVWARGLSSRLIHFFVGEPEDIPDRRFGFLLPNRREYARQHYHFLGYVTGFDPAAWSNKAEIRARLGYGKEPLLVCTTGGTAAGKELIELCSRAYAILRRAIRDLRMVAVCGELYGMERPALPAGAELHGYIPDLYQHFAACDMAVVVGGGTTTIELTALRRPFIFFPLEHHFDQEIFVADRLARQGAGLRMRYSSTTPESLAEAIRAHMGREVNWKSVPAEGAHKAAKRIEMLLREGQGAR